MGRFSLLPDYLSTLETWIVQIFLLFAVLIIGPWIVFILYDILLYLWRFAAYEIPYLGGRARGLRRPSTPHMTADVLLGHGRSGSGVSRDKQSHQDGVDAASASQEGSVRKAASRPHNSSGTE